jgi:hypothetical protein
MASNRKGWRYGRTTGADLGRFLNSMSADDLKRSVDELVIGTFGGAL